MIFKKDYTRILTSAIKAPSSHNIQPWIFEIGDNCVTLLPNMKKTMPIVDPDNRELFISLGCAWENLIIASSQYGYETEGIVSSKGVISIQFKKLELSSPEPLFPMIDKRQTNRNIFNYKKIDSQTIANFINLKYAYGATLYFWENTTKEFEILKDFVKKGNELQMNNSQFVDELKSVMRYNKKDSELFKDGLSYRVFGAPNLPKFISRTIMNSFLKADKQNKSDMKKIDSSSHMVLFTIENDSIEQWVYLGRALQRFLLTLAQEKIAVAFMNQPCEIKELKIQLSKKLNVHIPSILLRIGYAKEAPFSLRKMVNN